jgi:hypothetical protein
VPKEVMEVVKSVTDAAVENKSLFAKFCSCMGGSAPAKDADKAVKDAAEKVADAEKEDVEEVPEKAAAIEP